MRANTLIMFTEPDARASSKLLVIWPNIRYTPSSPRRCHLLKKKKMNIESDVKIISINKALLRRAKLGYSVYFIRARALYLPSAALTRTPIYSATWEYRAMCIDGNRDRCIALSLGFSIRTCGGVMIVVGCFDARVYRHRYIIMCIVF